MQMNGKMNRKQDSVKAMATKSARQLAKQTESSQTSQ